MDMDMDRIQIRESQSDYYNSRTATPPGVEDSYRKSLLYQKIKKGAALGFSGSLQPQLAQNSTC